ncbi:MAG: ABC transporter-related protein [Elusimicrobia bacterium]|nr:MAG: ABC transporter-related protein [Elusimicrobiota bacterium]KAF0157467.1 MAG: ABC transporter-related protein [Elusimicrobiota bacterium]
MSNSVLEAEGLEKSFKGFQALKRVSFGVRQGEILAYLGHNGAGKTTTIRCLLGLIRPTAGRISCMGKEVEYGSAAQENLRAKFGVCLDGGGFYPDLSAMDNLRFYAGLYGLGGAEFGERAETLLKKLDLHDFRLRPVKTFSKGMAQKLALIKALQHKPDLLFLDEPMSGLDPATRIMLREFLLELKRTEGVSIFITSHDLGEVEQLCDSVLILEKGAVKLSGPLAELKRAHSGLGFEIHTDRDALSEEDAAPLERIPGVSSVSRRGGVFCLESSGDISLEGILPLLSGKGIRIREFRKKEASLERIYMDSLERNEKPVSSPDKVRP